MTLIISQKPLSEYNQLKGYQVNYKQDAAKAFETISFNSIL